MTNKSKKLRAARIALQDIDPAKDLDDGEIRRGLESEGVNAPDIDVFFDRVWVQAKVRAGQKALESAHSARLARKSPFDMLAKIRAQSLDMSALQKLIEGFAGRGAQIAHRDLSTVTREDLESQYADLLMAAGIDPDHGKFEP